MAVGAGRLEEVGPGLPNKGLHPGEATLLREHTAFPLFYWSLENIVCLSLFVVLGWKLSPKEKPIQARDSYSQL